MTRDFKEIFVTGVAGFIGSSLARALLKQGVKVVGVDNINDYYDVNLKLARLATIESDPNFTFYKADIADKEVMEDIWAKHPDIIDVVHLAAQAGVRHSLKDPYSYVRSNVMGHLVIMELCRYRAGFRHLVYASSSSVYGGNTKIPFAATDTTDLPLSMYAATKKADELMTQSYCSLYGMAATGLRFFTVYGPWGRPDMSAYLFADAIIKDQPIQVFNYGDMSRDFTYIDDIVSGIIAALSRDLNHDHKVYNLGNNNTENLMDFIGVIEKCIGKEATKEMLPMQPGDVQKTYADIELSQKELGFQPKTKINEGLAKFIDWFLDYHKIKR